MCRMTWQKKKAADVKQNIISAVVVKVCWLVNVA